MDQEMGWKWGAVGRPSIKMSFGVVRLNNNDHSQLQQEFITVQNSFKTRIDCTDHFSESDIKTVAGVDLAYWKNENDHEYAVCCVVVIDYAAHDIIEKQLKNWKISPIFSCLTETATFIRDTWELLHTQLFT